MPKRKNLRLKNYDYSENGYYFVTICTHNKEKILWVDRLKLSNFGKIVKREIKKLNNIYDYVRVDKFCIMPNHVHIIIVIDNNSDCRGELSSSENEEKISGRAQLAPTISRIIQQFKGSITKQIGQSIWQKLFYDEVIRNQEQYNKIWQYIENNPLKWEMDEYFK